MSSFNETEQRGLEEEEEEEEAEDLQGGLVKAPASAPGLMMDEEERLRKGRTEGGGAGLSSKRRQIWPRAGSSLQPVSPHQCRHTDTADEINSC